MMLAKGEKRKERESFDIIKKEKRERRSIELIPQLKLYIDKNKIGFKHVVSIKSHKHRGSPS